MPGTLANDALAADLMAQTIATATTTTGAAVDVQYPGLVRVEAVIGAITGTTPTLDLEIQASNDSAFGAANTEEVGRFERMTDANDSGSFWLEAYVNKRYMRAVAITAGTAISVPITHVYVRPPHYKRTPLAAG